MLRFLRKQPHNDFNLGDTGGHSPLFIAIAAEDLSMVKFLIEEMQVDIEHVEN